MQFKVTFTDCFFGILKINFRLLFTLCKRIADMMARSKCQQQKNVMMLLQKIKNVYYQIMYFEHFEGLFVNPTFTVK